MSRWKTRGNEYNQCSLREENKVQHISMGIVPWQDQAEEVSFNMHVKVNETAAGTGL